MSLNNQNIEKLGINTVRIISAEAVQKANSGHPGMPMGAAPIGHELWAHVMNYNPKNPNWANRDRFVLSGGHGCMLLYSFLHLTGYDLSLDDIKNFRQLHSKTAGHPEYGLAPGIEVTTGPLGQGFANAVGFAIAEKFLAAKYNQPEFNVFDYKIYGICGDGDIQEGVCAEAASLAGHLQLGNIIFFYDDNHISIEGNTNLSFTEDVAKRFEAYGWHVEVVTDANDAEQLQKAVKRAQEITDKPSLIKVRTEIAYGSPNKAGSAGAHGSPLGDAEIKLVKEHFGFDPEKSFYIPEEVSQYYVEKGAKGAEKEHLWNELFAAYKAKHPALAAEYEGLSQGILPKGWEDTIPTFTEADGSLATRKSSGIVLNKLAQVLPNLIGGSADLAPSTDTYLKGFDAFLAGNYAGRNFHFGIREHAMAAILNGMVLTKGILPYGATFLIFSEYLRPAIRLAAIMKINPIYVFTHDSFYVGEDGTTHQPIEQLAALRAIPGLLVVRPADANETAQAWKTAILNTNRPTALILTRQNLPTLNQEKLGSASQLEKGAYILSDMEKAQLILIATGSEVSLAMDAQKALAEEGIASRVVSMPCWELFDEQTAEYKEQVLPSNLRKRLAIEAGIALGWHKYITDQGATVTINHYGESAPADQLAKAFGFTVENVVNKAKDIL